MIDSVEFSSRAKKDLRKIPKNAVTKLKSWVELVERDGVEETRKIPGYHDEPLRGKRKGQRSIRLNRSYRAIYKISREQDIEFILVEEVTKH